MDENELKEYITKNGLVSTEFISDLDEKINKKFNFKYSNYEVLINKGEVISCSLDPDLKFILKDFTGLLIYVLLSILTGYLTFNYLVILT